MHNAFAHQLLKLRTEQQLSQTDIANLLFGVYPNDLF